MLRENLGQTFWHSLCVVSPALLISAELAASDYAGFNDSPLRARRSRGILVFACVPSRLIALGLLRERSFPLENETMRMVFPTNMTGRFLDDLASEMNTIVETVLGDEPHENKAGFAPRMDFDETQDAFVAYIDLPGVDPAGVSIEMEDDQVIVSGERAKVVSDDDVKHHRVERSSGNFRRVIA